MEEKEKKVGMMVSGTEGFMNNSNAKQQLITTITDPKIIFNLEGKCDHKLNDCIDKRIIVTDMLCKIIEKPLKEPIVDKETGEILETTEYKMITILIDDNNESYVTASKIFYFQWKKFCMMFPDHVIKNGVEIKIINVPVKNSGNKALGFELV